MSGSGLDNLVVDILALIFSVVFHEVAHGWMALRHGDETALRLGRLTLNPLPHIDLVGSIIVPLMLSFTNSIMFGWAKPVPVDMRRLRDPWNDQPKVAAAGPAANLLLALICAVLLGLVIGLAALTHSTAQVLSTRPTPLKFLVSLFQTGIMINVVLAMFNLIPVPPLDGSWILSRFLPRDLHLRYEGLRRFGFVLVIGFLVLMRYTPLGTVFSKVLMALVHPFFSLAMGIARIFGA